MTETYDETSVSFGQTVTYPIEERVISDPPEGAAVKTTSFGDQIEACGNPDCFCAQDERTFEPIEESETPNEAGGYDWDAR